MKSDLHRLLAALGTPAGTDGDNATLGAAGAATAQDVDTLLEAWAELEKPHRFSPGDLVRWKRTPASLCLANRTRPAPDEVAVVVQHLAQPVLLVDGDVDAGHPAWREPLSLQLGVLDDDGQLEVFHYDAARFEPVPKSRARQAVAQRLQALQACLAGGHPLRPGMAVRWKPGLKNRRFPAEGQAAVVLQVLPEPVLDPAATSGTPYFREPLDVVLGVLVDGSFQRLHSDSRRFEPLAPQARPS